MVAIIFNNGCKVTQSMQWLRRAWRFAIQIATEHASRQHLSNSTSRAAAACARSLALELHDLFGYLHVACCEHKFG
jgi:hypothetical protein